MSTPRLRRDERVCPFCAETIKAAAIKCRYCGSELAEHPDVPSTAPREVLGEPAVPDRSDSPGRPWATSPVTALLLALLVAAAALGSILVGKNAWDSPVASNGQTVSEAARSVDLDEVSRATATVLSYRAASFEADSRSAQALMTASMRAQYLATLDKARANVAKYGLNLSAKVASVGLLSATSDQIKALVFLNQTTTAKNSKNTQVDQNRAVVTMVRTVAGWRISGIAPF